MGCPLKLTDIDRNELLNLFDDKTVRYLWLKSIVTSTSNDGKPVVDCSPYDFRNGLRTLIRKKGIVEEVS